jgi:hypothetical protein
MKVVKQQQRYNLAYLVKSNDERELLAGPFATRSAARNWVRDHKAGEAKIAANRHNNLSAN